MFDRSFLPQADLEFVVMTDTHYMLDPGTQRIEFESRRRQSSRSAHALGLVASLEPSFIVHLGDLVQEFPESDGFTRSVDQALAQFAEHGIRPRQVAGNHDVGDKPDPTMPTDWVSSNTLQRYHERFGPSWYSWDEAGYHFVVLNSQIMNGSLPEVGTQERWLEDDLAAHAGMPVFIFLHLTPFLYSEHEQSLGHYDNIDEPARSWLLSLVRRHNVQMVFSGHSHFSFFNRIGDARSRVVPSTSFTRPGFCEVFSSAPPPERGRDDVAKLGFLLVRMRNDQASVHLIRTDGGTPETATNREERRIVTGTSRDLADSPLGLILRHPLASSTEVPIAWQSNIRQPVRNDYPLLACVELGARHVHVPSSDLTNQVQRERLAALKDEGVAITASWIWSERLDLAAAVAPHRDLLDGVEIQLPSTLLPSKACVETIRRLVSDDACAVTLSPLLPKEVVPGKQHARTRVGFHLDELNELERCLAGAGVSVDRALCRVHADRSPWDAIREASQVPTLQYIGALDWALEFDGPDQHHQVARAAEAIAAVSLDTSSRLFFEPLIDLDRTMDTPLGLLDRLCNPRPVFHAVRTLNTILHAGWGHWTPVSSQPTGGIETIALDGPTDHLLLVANGGDRDLIERLAKDVQARASDSQPARLVDLEAATITPLEDALDGSVDHFNATVILVARGGSESAR